MLITWLKGRVWDPLTLCQQLAYCNVDTRSADGCMSFICHMIKQNHFVEMSSVFMGGSSSLHVPTLKILVTIGIHHAFLSKTSYKYILTLKNWVDWITTKREKMSETQKWYILRRSAQKLKNMYIFFSLWLPSIT